MSRQNTDAVEQDDDEAPAMLINPNISYKDVRN
jgi:hypothetical protein